MPGPSQFKNTQNMNFDQTSMPSVSFVGPKALFDPNFIPPKFSLPEKQIFSIQTMLADSIEDHYPLNINVFGIKGTGKNLLLNYSLKNMYLSIKNLKYSKSEQTSCCILGSDLISSWDIVPLKAKIQENQDKFACTLHNSEVLSYMGIVFLRIDCNQKECNQIFFNLIIQLGKLIKKTLSIQDIVQLSDAKLWNLLKLLIQKINRPIILYFQKPDEMIHGALLSKFYNFSKNQRNFQILTSMDCGLSRGVLKPIEGMDHKIFLDQYSSKDLQLITQERNEMAFQQPLVTDAIKIIVDYILDFDTKVPGSCVNYLKDLYPVVQQHGELRPEYIRDLSQFHFENFTFDAISMADFVSNTTFEDRLFLDYLINSFQKSDRYYISYADMFKSYKMACEELGMIPNKSEFIQSLVKITDANILRPSYNGRTSNMKMSYGIWPVAHYLTMPIDEMSEIMKLAFGDLDFGEGNHSKEGDDFENSLY